MQKEYFLKDKNRGVAGLVKWWQGTGAIIDVFSSEAVEWYIAKLNNLKQLGIDSFKFDAGEYIYMPYGEPSLHLREWGWCKTGYNLPINVLCSCYF